MQSILRHPNIALLMGCCPSIPNIVIVYELVDNSLFTLLHMKRSQEVPLKLRVKIALDCARVYFYMHNLGIVHRDIKSHNVLIDANHNVKVCDFGLARFVVSKRPTITCVSHLVFCSGLRLIWELARCNSQAHPATWPLNSFKSDSITRVLMFLPLARSCGRSSSVRYPTMASNLERSEPRLKVESPFVRTTASMVACYNSSMIAALSSPAVVHASAK